MLNDLLPDNFTACSIGKLPDLAKNATKSGDFAQAAAILAKGYEIGGPPVYLEQAYTYAHYLIVSRRMVRRGAAAIKDPPGQTILDNFASLYSDDLIDRLETHFDAKLRQFRGAEKEPSGAHLLAAELCLANGANVTDVEGRLPQSEAVATRARLIAARASRADGDLDKARAILGGILDNTPRNQTALTMMGDLSRKQGDLVSAADYFDKSMRAAFTPLPDGKIPVGEIHLRSTILNRFDVYAYAGGFLVIKKQKGLLGVTMLGRTALQVMESPGYRKWMRIKGILNKFIRVDRIKALLFPLATNIYNSGRKRRNPFMQKAIDFFDRLARGTVAERYRPQLKSVFHKFCRFIAPARILIWPITYSVRRLRSLLHRPGLRLSNKIYRTVVLSWLQAKEIPRNQRAKDPDEIFFIISQLIGEEEESLP